MKKKEKDYQNIDMQKTGDKIRGYVNKYGYSVKELQNAMDLACPQPIYRWFNGQVLPSVDNLYVLSKLFRCHMEDLLVADENICVDYKRYIPSFQVYWDLYMEESKK